MEREDDLDLLTSLLDENEDVEDPHVQKSSVDDLDDLFDNDDDDVEYEDGIAAEKAGGKDDVVTDLFGDVDDIEDEETEGEQQAADAEDDDSLNKSKEDLQEELRRMQEKMQKLQQQLSASQKPPPASAATPGRGARTVASVKKKSLSQCGTPAKGSATQTPSKGRTPAKGSVTQTTAKTPSSTQKTKLPAAKSSPPDLVRGGDPKRVESSDFSDQLVNADMFKRKPRTAHLTKPSTSPEDRGPLVEIKIGSTFQPVEPRPQPSNSQPRPAPPPDPKDVAVEKYSGLRLRNPLVSSCEMDRKMAERRLIRLSQLPQRIVQEKLEDSDWVTFAVLINKATRQAKGSGNTFSTWTLSDLHDLEVCVTLMLFGNEHKEHWKTEVGTVIGVLNPNLMKQRDGYDGISLSVDNPQKVLLMGTAQDYGTCKGMKKNGDPCSKIVNMYDCQFCQYHVTAAYKKMSSKRAELQSSYSGKVPGKVKGAVSLKERLCQGGFYYGGVSSSACVSSLGGSKPNKSTQLTLDSLFVKGASKQVDEAKRLVVKSGEVSGCSDDFKSLMSHQTPGALQLKKHLLHAKTPGSPGGAGSGMQSISASDLLKQQKKMQLELLESRRRRAAEALQKQAGPTSTSVSHPTSAPRVSPSTSAPRVSSSTSAPRVSSSTSAPRVSPSTSAPRVSSSTSAPRVSPSTSAPRVSPSTSAPRVSPSTSAPRVSPSTAAPRVSPSTSAPRVSPSLSRGPAGPLLSPKAASEVPRGAARSPPAAHAPTLGRGFSEGDDIVFFDRSPQQAPPPAALGLSAAKMAALRRLKAKGAGLAKDDPNAVKRKRSSKDGEISARVEKNMAAVEGDEAEEEEPAQKRRRDLSYIQSDEFQKILKAKSRHQAALQAAEYQIQERYFDPLVKKEQLEEKMRDTKEMKCRAVSCKQCNYTYFKPADRCVEGNHQLKWHDALKRFFKCPCGQRSIALDRLPSKHCSNCGLFKWQRDGMLREKKGPKIAGELLQPRGDEGPKFLNSMQ
ncbi:protein MCM10 homolog isoform X2 [Gadus macrocephalus]|uniref:protein MCM10 homolog isoform X2 n=1 Tax=Gadus macrocephalus TaxID=80720 RepID=UPI0028CB5A4C|nr:protein MCM10 homolog isoform X2 [Gadus macrocephalus]